MKDEVYREPLESLKNRFCEFTLNEHDLFQMRWTYTVEWGKTGRPKIWIVSYVCWQRKTKDVPFEQVENLPIDIPISEQILDRMAEHAGQELYRHSVIVGS